MKKFLKLFLQALKRVNLELHRQLIWVKQFETMTWVLEWGVYSNSRAIKNIKDNLRIPEGQNVLQEDKNSFVGQVSKWYIYHGE